MFSRSKHGRIDGDATIETVHRRWSPEERAMLLEQKEVPSCLMDNTTDDVRFVDSSGVVGECQMQTVALSAVLQMGGVAPCFETCNIGCSGD